MAAFSSETDPYVALARAESTAPNSAPAKPGASPWALLLSGMGGLVTRVLKGQAALAKWSRDEQKPLFAQLETAIRECKAEPAEQWTELTFTASYHPDGRLDKITATRSRKD